MQTHGHTTPVKSAEWLFAEHLFNANAVQKDPRTGLLIGTRFSKVTDSNKGESGTINNECFEVIMECISAMCTRQRIGIFSFTAAGKDRFSRQIAAKVQVSHRTGHLNIDTSKNTGDALVVPSVPGKPWRKNDTAVLIEAAVENTDRIVAMIRALRANGYMIGHVLSVVDTTTTAKTALREYRCKLHSILSLQHFF